MKKTNKKTLEEIIRVDHAGERSAIKIYEGQLLALKTIKQDNDLKDKIEEMKEQEKEHLEYFEKEIQKRKIKPTSLLPLWDLMGVTLGFGTALKAIEEANIEGFDYLEFKQSINNLKKQKLGNDEKQLFITAFTLAKTMNVDKNSLLESAGHYLKVLENENIRFNESLNNSAKVKLAEREEELRKLESTLKKEKNQLIELQKKIDAHEKQVIGLKQELQQAGLKVKRIKAGFKKALSDISSQISSDIEKIKKYIK